MISQLKVFFLGADVDKKEARKMAVTVEATRKLISRRLERDDDKSRQLARSLLEEMASAKHS